MSRTGHSSLNDALNHALSRLMPGSGPARVLTSALTGETLAEVATCTVPDLLATVDAARRQFPTWAQAPHSARRKVLREFLRLVDAHRPDLLRLAQHTCALSSQDAGTDHGEALGPRARTAAGAWAGRLLTQRRLPAPPTGHRPAVVSTLTESARPFTTLLEPVLPALTAGSCVVTQVTGRTAPIGAHLLSLARRAGLPPDAWQLVLGDGSDLSCVLAEHADEHTVLCCPQGHAPALFIVRHDAHLPTALRAALVSCFATAGRPCTGTPLVAVHERHFPRFEEEFTAATARLPIRPPLAPDACLSSMADAAQLRSFQTYLHDARAAGAVTLHDGGHRPDLGPFVHGPVVLARPDAAGPLPHAIPPGPVAQLLPFHAWSEVLQLARRTSRHLGLHTRTSMTQLTPQLTGLPATDIRVNHTLRRHPLAAVASLASLAESDPRSRTER